jgi:hypothetical protein
LHEDPSYPVEPYVIAGHSLSSVAPQESPPWQDLHDHASTIVTEYGNRD